MATLVRVRSYLINSPMHKPMLVGCLTHLSTKPKEVIMYYGDFSCWDDLVCQFGLSNRNQDDIVVLFAAYDVPDYDGYATVVYVQNGKFYLVEGAHCSCYGLEDQWDPEEMPLEALLQMANEGLGLLSNYNNQFKDALRIVQELGLVEADPSDAQLALKLTFG